MTVSHATESVRREGCQVGTCYSGAYKGFPAQYSMDGKCGIKHNNLLCGGKWGTCCDISGQCGTGESFCGVAKCQNGNCTIVIPPPSVGGQSVSITTALSSSTLTPGSISSDGPCGGTNKYICKDSTFGDCCSSSGFCGLTAGHCQAGCIWNLHVYQCLARQDLWRDKRLCLQRLRIWRLL
jgi:hypothetical protein